MRIKFALQENDARGEGQVIFLECICSCSSGFRWCPAGLLKKRNMKRWRRHWSDGEKINQLLFATRSGIPMDKAEVLTPTEYEVRSKGHDLRDEQGRRKFGGQFFRILGARMMAEAGIDKLRIMDVGRWKTLSVMEIYLKGDQYEKVAKVSRKVWGELSENPSASSMALERVPETCQGGIMPGIGEAVERGIH